jgi:hypothetical protein
MPTIKRQDGYDGWALRKLMLGSSGVGIGQALKALKKKFHRKLRSSSLHRERI